jgi:hypothetical protein
MFILPQVGSNQDIFNSQMCEKKLFNNHMLKYYSVIKRDFLPSKVDKEKKWGMSNAYY